jgi:hypothetical protein
MTTTTQYYYQSIDSWAEQNLSPSELVQFRAAQQANPGPYSSEIMYERIFVNELNTEVDIAICKQFRFAPGGTPYEFILGPDWRSELNHSS